MLELVKEQVGGELDLFHYHIQYKDWAQAIMIENCVAVVHNHIVLKVCQDNINQELEYNRISHRISASVRRAGGHGEEPALG